MSDRKVLPAATVPEAGYDLLYDFARSKKMSLSEAMRYLLQGSSELQAYAKKTGVTVNLTVQAWGGYRERAESDEGDEGSESG